MPRRKDISNEVREATVAVHQSWRDYQAIFKQFKVHHFTVRQIIHKWKTFKTVVSLVRSGRPSKFTPRSNCNAQRNCKKN
uniref:Sleeping Beauty transposase HTH domain-containing protein n=1 Tax=Lates calcarifer TaxID=8187 RepID=A0A4W6CXH4_LATCA